MIYDTQIISYCHSGKWDPKIILGAQISSVIASEFLLFQENSKPKYYVINPLWFNFRHVLQPIEQFKNPKWAKASINRTDSVLIDLKGDYDSYRMFGNEAISEIINSKSMKNFEISIAHLNKSDKKKLKKKLEFLLDNNIYCHRLSENDCELAIILLSEFKKSYQVKKNIKNTMNDLLILATAINQRLDLYTEDKVLGEFSSKYLNATIVDNNNSIVVSFPHPEDTQIIMKQSESKGYINRGCQYSMRKGNL